MRWALIIPTGVNLFAPEKGDSLSLQLLQLLPSSSSSVQHRKIHNNEDIRDMAVLRPMHVPTEAPNHTQRVDDALPTPPAHPSASPPFQSSLEAEEEGAAPQQVPQKKKKKKKPKKSAKSKESSTNSSKTSGNPDEDRPPVLCISRNKHWRYISSYHVCPLQKESNPISLQRSFRARGCSYPWSFLNLSSSSTWILRLCLPQSHAHHLRLSYLIPLGAQGPQILLNVIGDSLA